MLHLNPPPKSQLELTRSNILITPDSCSVIATSGGEEVTRRARCDRDNRVLVPLEHHLSMSRVWIPELHAPIFGAAHHPFSARCQAHAKYVVLNSRLAKRKYQRNKRSRTLWPSNVLIHFPPFGVVEGRMLLCGANSHILIVLSRLPLTNSRPVGENATEYTLSLCPSGPSRRWTR
jgi:hypothetical protein